MAGFADSPFAVTPFGAGTPATATAPPSKAATGAAYIDPIAKQYVLDDEGELERMPEVRQQMLLAVTTLVESSSAEPGRGVRLSKKITDDSPRQNDVAVRSACAHITDAKRAVIKNVKTETTSSGLAQITISYDDLTLGTTDNRLTI